MTEQLAPLDFIASLDGNDNNNNIGSRPMHIALFYEDERYAREIEYSFVKNGLARSQQCIYTTHGVAGEDDSVTAADGNNNNNGTGSNSSAVARIRAEMAAHGIDVHRFESAGLLRILLIKDPREDPSGFVYRVWADERAHVFVKA
jgi:hypothetical protein